MINLSLAEKTILENIKCEGKELNWLVRDGEGDLMAFVNKPKRNNNKEILIFEYWIPSNNEFVYLEEFNHLFKFVKFRNEPISIKGLL